MFRISNDLQRAKTAAAIKGFKKQKENLEKTKGKKTAEIFWKASRGQISTLETQMERYDQLKKGLPPFQGRELSELGAYLVDARIASGMTQQELANRLGVSQPMVFKYETGEYQGFSLDILEKAAAILNVRVDLSAWQKKGKIVYSEKRQENAILYFLNGINNAFLGKTKLMKLLYYADFEFFSRYGLSITGDTYTAQPYGPVPEKAENLLKKMESEGKLHSEKARLREFDQTKYYPNIVQDLTVFEPAQIQHLENIAKRFEHWSARQMTDSTHEEYPWKITHLGEVIDYKLAASLAERE